jgi:hypothetical protein
MSSRWAVCLVVLIGGAGLVHASWGDTSHEYRECKDYCLKKNCTRAVDLELWTSRQTLAEYLVGGWVKRCIQSYFYSGN